MNTEIIDILQGFFTEEIELVEEDFGAAEVLVIETMRSLGRGFLQRLAGRGRNGYQGSSIACSCGGSMRFIGHRGRDIHTLFGWIRIERAYYHCSDCGRGLCPYDRSGGLGPEQLSPALAKACCLLAVEDSFQESSEKVNQLFGQDVSERTIERVVHNIGAVAMEQQQRYLDEFFCSRQIARAEFKPDLLYTSADGTMVCEKDGWHEAKIGCLYWEDEDFQQHCRYVGGFDNSEDFGWQLWLEACRCGLREAEKTVYIGDGAAWIANEGQKHFPGATHILDWYHASEHVWDCGKILFGEGTRKTERWARKRLDQLWDGCTRKLLNCLKRKLKQCRGHKRKALNELIGYISKNEEKMRYDVFRAAGLHIGSGMVEAACKRVVGKRLKQSGMRWSRSGSSATLALRIVWLNGDWNKLWSQKPLAA